MVAVNLLRALVAGGLAVAVSTGLAGILLLYGVLFIVGVAEVVADNASSALVPAVVASGNLSRANARLVTVFMVGNQFAGPPLGAWLFVAGAALPFGVEAAGFLVAALLLVGMNTPPTTHQTERRDRGWLRRDVTEGVRWLWQSPTVRLLAIVLGVMNVTFMAAFAVWVLYAGERLGLSGSGFGLLLTASALGGLAGAALTGRLTDRFGAATLLRTGLLVETGVHVVLALTRDPWVAGATMVGFGAHTAVWGVVVVTIRQRLVPARLLGRVKCVLLAHHGRCIPRRAVRRVHRQGCRPDGSVLGRRCRQRRAGPAGLAPAHSRCARAGGPPRRTGRRTGLGWVEADTLEVRRWCRTQRRARRSRSAAAGGALVRCRPTVTATRSW